MHSSVVLTLPIRIQSPNVKEHWCRAYKRNKSHKIAIRLSLRNQPIPPLPVVVTLTRIAPRAYDNDNLISAFKSVRDSVSDVLIPGLPPGLADSSPQIEWKYLQEKGKTAIRISIDPAPTDTMSVHEGILRIHPAKPG